MNARVQVHWVDAAAPALPAEGVTVIGIAGRPDRETARSTIRAALRKALAAHWALGEDMVELHSPPGEAPWALVRLAGAPRRIPLAISHDGALSVGAFAAGNAVGIDISHVVPMPDWEAVARDYLGPDVVRGLGAVPLAQRDAAFARAWSEHEARLKYFGLQLDEWREETAAGLRHCRCLALAVPDGYVGFLALAPAGT
jgi:4'-phosphopantetheinyl transferase